MDGYWIAITAAVIAVISACTAIYQAGLAKAAHKEITELLYKKPPSPSDGSVTSGDIAIAETTAAAATRGVAKKIRFSLDEMDGSTEEEQLLSLRNELSQFEQMYQDLKDAYRESGRVIAPFLTACGHQTDFDGAVHCGSLRPYIEEIRKMQSANRAIREKEFQDATLRPVRQKSQKLHSALETMAAYLAPYLEDTSFKQNFRLAFLNMFPTHDNQIKSNLLDLGSALEKVRRSI